MTELTRTIHKTSRGVSRCVQTFHGFRRVTLDFHGESWTTYLIIPRATLIEGIRRRRAAGASYNDCPLGAVIPGIDRWIRPAGYGGPGRPFATEPFRYGRSRRFRVIAQSGGLDV